MRKQFKRASNGIIEKSENVFLLFFVHLGLLNGLLRTRSNNNNNKNTSKLYNLGTLKMRRLSIRNPRTLNTFSHYFM